MKNNTKISKVRTFVLLMISLITVFVLFCFWFFGYYTSTLDKINEYINLKNKITFQDGGFCFKEGSSYNTANFTKIKCCQDLSPLDLSMSYNKENDSFSDGCSFSLSNDVVVCLNCGNGICDIGENYCNCKIDCTKDESIGKPPYPIK